MLPVASAPEEPRLPQEFPQEFSAKELREFLAPDLHTAEADPAFRERLRQRLWALMQQRSAGDQDHRLD